MNPVIRYALAALLLLGSPFSYAANYWLVSYNTTYKNYYGGSFGEAASQLISAHPSISSVTLGSLVSSSGTTDLYQLCTNGSCSQTSTKYAQYKTVASCPSQVPYEWTDGTCHDYEEPPETYTCSTGKVMFAEVTKDESGEFPDSICAPQTGGGEDYCMYGRVSGPTITESDTMSLVYATASESPVSCDTPDDIGDTVRFPFNPDSFTGEITEQDTFFTKSDNNYSPPQSICTPNGDGTDTCVTITSRTETIMSGAGTTTTSDGTTATQVTDTGTMTTKTETTETVDDGNGTSTSTTTNTNTVQSGSQTTQSINGNDGSSTTTVTKPAGKPITTETTTITTTNPDGTTTTQVVTKTKDGDGNTTEPVDDAGKEGNCGAPGQPACEINLGDESVLTDPNQTLSPATIFEPVDGLITDIENPEPVSDSSFIVDMPLDLGGGQNCDAAYFDFNYHGESVSPMAGFCEAYDSVGRSALSFFVWGITVIAIYFIFVSAVKSQESA